MVFGRAGSSRSGRAGGGGRGWGPGEWRAGARQVVGLARGGLTVVGLPSGPVPPSVPSFALRGLVRSRFPSWVGPFGRALRGLVRSRLVSLPLCVALRRALWSGLLSFPLARAVFPSWLAWLSVPVWSRSPSCAVLPSCGCPSDGGVPLARRRARRRPHPGGPARGRRRARGPASQPCGASSVPVCSRSVSRAVPFLLFLPSRVPSLLCSSLPSSAVLSLPFFPLRVLSLPLPFLPTGLSSAGFRPLLQWGGAASGRPPSRVRCGAR